MSVQEKIPYVSYIANGSTAKFNIPFDLHNAGYLVVTVDKMIPAVGGYIVNLNDMSITYRDWETDRKSTRLNSSHRSLSRMPSSA